jgi:hypothetical protein
MAWLVKKGSHLLHAGTTASDSLAMFIKLTSAEPKSLVSEAVEKFTKTGKTVKVNGYSIKWE